LKVATRMVGFGPGGQRAGDVEQGVEHRLRDLQHLGRRLVALLVLDQPRGLLVEVDAGLSARAVRPARRALEISADRLGPCTRTPMSAIAAMKASLKLRPPVMLPLARGQPDQGLRRPAPSAPAHCRCCGRVRRGRHRDADAYRPAPARR
jgi:hypothetical protein